MDYTNIPTGLKVPSQIPLNTKEYVKNEAELANLGLDDNKAFTYHDQLEVVCIEEKKTYLWREVELGEENTGLVTEDFTYPIGSPNAYGIPYAGRKFNFFEVVYATGSSDLVNVGNGQKIYVDNELYTGQDKLRTITKTGSLINITSSSTEINITVDEAALQALIDNGPGNLQKIITSDYTLTNEDDKHTIFIENGVTEVLITVPEGLSDNFFCAFYQLGDGTVQISQDIMVGSPLIFTPIGKYIKGKYYWAHLEKVEGREEYGLLATVQLQE